METTVQEKEMIRDIIRHLISGDKKWFDENLIIVGDKGQYWILNYQQGGRNAYNRLVRGMVVQKPAPGFNGDPLSLIRSFPFIRFYNHGEGDAAPVNFHNAEMLEKMDGTMVGVFFPHGEPSKPEFHTRKMMSTHDEDMGRTLTTFDGKQAKFLPAIRQFIDQLQFTKQDTTYTYVFEFLHEISYVLTKYKPHHYGLYLLGARNLATHREMNEDQLDATAKRIGAKRPRRFDAIADHAEIQKMFAQMAAETPDFEGVIFRDKVTGERVKVKDPKYVEKHHLLDNLSFKNLLPLILKGEEEETVAYFPHAKERIDKIKEAYTKYLNRTVQKVQEWQAKGLSGKELAMDMLGGVESLPKWELRLLKAQGKPIPKTEPKEKDTFIKNAILKYIKITDEGDLKKQIDSDMRQIALGTPKNPTGSPKALIELIGLHDVEEEEQPKTDVGEI